MSAMAEEIAQIPAVLTGLLVDGRDEIKTLANQVRGQFRRAVFVGRGSSDHAATYARYLFETELGIPGSLAAPSVTTVYGAAVDWSDALVVGVSQSGRSPDLVAVLEEARSAGAVTLAVTNDTSSPLAMVAQNVLDCAAGEEKSVPATKSYVAELAAIAALVAELAGDATLVSELDAVPRSIAGFLSAADLATCGLLTAVAAADGVLVLGRGYNLATAYEVALKLTETCGLCANGYSAADFEHGPAALIERGSPVIVLRADGPAAGAVQDVIDRLRRGLGGVWIVGTGADADVVLPEPLPDRVSPMLLAIPGLMLAEQAARLRGANPDAPPGLQKVTETL